MDQCISHYRLIRKLGAGGMGEVYLAEDLRLTRQVALKLPSPEMAREPEHRMRFLREARAASVLNHPNICVTHEVGETEDGRPFIAMEFIDGRNLTTRLAEGPISISEVVNIATQVADALDAAHAKNIVHRDIKSANIVLDERGRVKVLDFGLAKRLVTEGPTDGHCSTQSLATGIGAVLGTPAYMSPEQALGRPIDYRSDIYSLGVVLYELLTSRLPFPGSTYAEVATKVVHEQPLAIARFNYNVPAELERITIKCLAKDPERRFQSARDLMIDLKNLQRTLENEGDQGRGSLAPIQAPVVSDALFESFPAGEVSHDAGLPFDKLSNSDVLITYSKLDDQPFMEGRPGWISQFYRNLGLRVAQLSGKEVMVWKQPDSSAKSPSIEQQLLEHVPGAKTIVSVLSPPFVRSTGCKQVLQTFWQAAEKSGRLQVNQLPRIVNVVKTPVEPADIPLEMQPLFSRLVPYEFFERDPQSGRLREFDEVFGESAKQRFYERIYDVAFDISQVLKHFGDDAPKAAGRSTNNKTIFLAAATSDLEAYRDQLRRELTELGHEVLPKQPLPLVASEIASAVRGCLEHCDLAIHFVGEHYGLVPEATELSVVALQNQVAAEWSGTHRLERIIWLPKGTTPRDERQAVFIRDLQREPALHQGAEVIIDTLENLKSLLRSRWSRQLAAADRPMAAKRADSPPRIYLICDQQDEEAIEPIEDFFYEQGIEVSLPGFGVSEAEVQRIHIQNLRDCDAALIYYGAAGKHWVDFNIRDLQKAAGYRESVPITVAAAYLAPPFDRRKERFKSVSVDVIRQETVDFDSARLAAFAAAVIKSKDSSRNED